MTREEVIEEVKAAFDIWESEYDTGNDWSKAHKARDMAIKAIKQEPVLDKIKSEIEQEIIPRNSDQYDYEAKWQNMGLRIALKAIDKCKAESEK